MNWLAHVYLSEDDPGVRLGNLVADLVKGADRRKLSPPLCRGIAHHQRVDAFTDYHPCFHRSKRRIPAPFDRFAGILVDIFYDHLLARDWQSYSARQLDAFVGDVYRTFPDHYAELPLETCAILARMAEQDWLGSYRTTSGIEDVLRRLSRRIEQRIGINPRLEATIVVLDREIDAFASDFEAFFPELRRKCGFPRPDTPANAATLGPEVT